MATAVVPSGCARGVVERLLIFARPAAGARIPALRGLADLDAWRPVAVQGLSIGGARPGQ